MSGSVAAAPSPARSVDAERPEPIRLSRVVGRNGGGLGFLLVLIAALGLGTDTFLTGTNLDNLGRQVSIFGILAIGELFVILTAGIDLSVGSVVALSGASAALLLVHGLPVVLAVVIALVIGLIVGLVNGVLVAFAGLQPFIVTLGMLGMAQGVELVFTGARTVQPLPASFTSIANSSALIPTLLWVMIGVALLAGFVLRTTVFGDYVYAVGSDAEASRLNGVPVRGVLLTVYLVSGLLAAISGVLLASRLGAGVPTAGTGYELQAIAACVIGGASLFGARGGALGAIVGALIVAVLTNGGDLLAIQPFYLQIVTGALIVIAVGVDEIRRRRRRRPSRHEETSAPPASAEMEH